MVYLYRVWSGEFFPESISRCPHLTRQAFSLHTSAKIQPPLDRRIQDEGPGLQCFNPDLHEPFRF